MAPDNAVVAAVGSESATVVDYELVAVAAAAAAEVVSVALEVVLGREMAADTRQRYVGW